MQKMSTGEDATLGNYRKMAVVFFGAESGAVKYLDKLIEEQGEGEEVIADEGQVVNLLFTLTYGGGDGQGEGAITGKTV